jgi:hypothetical protein
MSDLEKDGKLHVLVHCQMGIPIFAELLELQPNAWPLLYGTQLAKRPEMGNYMREHGRRREVDMATQHGSLTF